jgi:predicted permease
VQSPQFDDKDGELGMAFVLCGLFAICIAAFSLGGYLLEPPSAVKPSSAAKDNTVCHVAKIGDGKEPAEHMHPEGSTSSHAAGDYLDPLRTPSSSDLQQPAAPCSAQRSSRAHHADDALSIRAVDGCQGPGHTARPPAQQLADPERERPEHSTGAECDSAGASARDTTTVPARLLLDSSSSGSRRSGWANASSVGRPDGAPMSPQFLRQASEQITGRDVDGSCSMQSDSTSSSASQASEAPREVAAELARCRRRHWLRRGASAVAPAVLNAPTIAVGIGLLVALVPALNHVFFAQGKDTDAASKDRPPLDVITQSLKTIGGAMIPSLLLTLGASLSRGPGAAVPVATLISVCVIRVVLLPVAGAGCVFGLRAAGVFHEPAAGGRMYMFVLLLQHAMPSALNVYTLARVKKNHAEEVATMLFWQYIVSILTIPLSLGIFLSLV